jgi:hypothetical protein
MRMERCRNGTLESSRSQPKAKRWLVLVFLLVCATFLYLQTCILPDVPIVAGGDQGIHLSLAARMLDGQVMYRDFDHFPLPGTEVLYFAIFKLVGVRAWIAPSMLILIGVTIAWLSVNISQKLMTGPIVFLPGLLFVTLPFSGFLDATHHWYSTLFGTAALAVVMERRSNRRLVCAGLLWGLAACFAQSAVLGALGLVLAQVWERRHHREPWRVLLGKEARFIASLGLTLVVFNAYFVWKAGVKRFFYSTVVFLVKYYPADHFNQPSVYMAYPPSRHEWTAWPNLTAFLLIYFLVPLVYILFFVRYWREAKLHPEEPWERLMLISLTGLFWFASVVYSAGISRLFPVSLPALILVVWFLKAPFKTEKVLLRALWTTTLILAFMRPFIIQTSWNGNLDLPTGRTAFPGSPQLYDKTRWVAERTEPGDYFFADPHICLALRLRDPSRVPFLRPTDYTRPEEVEDAIRALEQHRVRFVGWYSDLDNESTDPAGDHLGPLRAYLRKRYHVAVSFSNSHEIWYQVWERNR